MLTGPAPYERVLEVLPGDEVTRLDRFVVEREKGLSRSLVQRLISQGAILVNGVAVKPNYIPEPGDIITIVIPGEGERLPLAEDLPLDIIYEDDDIIVVNKPSGLTVHPGAGHSGGTLVNALLAHRPDIAEADLEPYRPGIVHRLDRETSGLLVVACNRRAQHVLRAAFKSRQVHKSYLALLHGRLQPEMAAIEAPIGRHPRRRQRMAVVAEGGRYARTEYRVREYIGNYTYVEAKLITGRTHQARVHFAALGHPIVGDKVYGRRTDDLGLGRQFLHSWRLEFDHPLSGEHLSFEAALPGELVSFLDSLRREANSV